MKPRILFLFLAAALLFGSRSYAVTIRISSAAGATVCSGTSVVFTSTVTPTGSYGYLWKLNRVSSGGSVDTFAFTPHATGKDTVYCFLTNLAGDTVKAYSDTVILTVDSLPILSSISGKDSLCVGSSYQLSDSVGGGIWSSSNQVAATVSSTGSVTALSVPVGMTIFGFTLPPAPVNITYSVTNSCGTDSIQQQINIAEPAGPIIVPTNSVCIGDTILLSDATTSGLWISSDSSVASFPYAAFAMFVPAMAGDLLGNATGTVTITYVGRNGCGAFLKLTTINVVNCDSVNAVPKVNSLAQGCSIYPNPATGTFYVTVNSGKYSEAHCTVSDMLGAKVKELVLNTNKETPVQMNVPPGVYIITLTAGSERYTSKLVVVQ